ncbi:MAG: serine/threonine protein kinase [Candidatus Hydrogenedentes bacterium]|jgi:serine/threonine-protein kinase|nr:serine/threonine protein kinase [Candidatus Hydrogenedentota bacterium]
MVDSQYTPDIPKLYHYKLQRVLGEGGTGKVYLGIDMNKGAPVAIKLFHENFFRNRLHVRDLAKSIIKFKRFKHNNVVQILDFIDDTQGRCLVMEYVDGPSLKWYLLNRPYRLNERINIALQICQGMQYLHDKGCIHHDFKPSNVLFTRTGIVKIADFSLYGNTFLLELIDRNVGEQITPMFVAPEFIRKEKVTNQSDIYSMGITFYMLFTDKVPFPVDSLKRLYQCHLTIMPEHPSLANPACPNTLGDIIMKMIAKRPELRFNDCDELSVAITQMSRSRI